MSTENQARTVVLSGASGLLGGAVQGVLAQNGLRTLRLVRRALSGPDELVWNPFGVPAFQDPDRLEGCFGVVHLSGASLAGRRWSAHTRTVLVESRVGTTATLARMLAELKSPPKVLIVASAVGIYGNRGNELLDETSSSGEGFLADLCRAWEEAAQPAKRAGIRVVHARFGVVLAKQAGALNKILQAFRLGLGGKLGSGQQWLSWISLEDAADAVLFLLSNESISGPVNVTAPNPVTNAEFTQKLARQLGRPAMIPVPAMILRMVFGEMAEETLLSSQRAMPSKLITAGFRFRNPAVADAFRAALS